MWIGVGKTEDIPRLGSRVVETGLGNIAIFRTSEDEFFALKDQCPHKQGPLSQGIVYDKRVTCPLHNWVIALDTGKATGPDEGCTQRFPIKVENNRVYFEINDDVKKCA